MQYRSPLLRIALFPLLASCTFAPQPSHTASATCVEQRLLENLNMSEGGRLTIALSGDLAKADLTFLAEGPLTMVKEVDRLLVYADYGSTDAGTLHVTCPAGENRVPITVRQIAWSKVASWTSGGPPGREYGAWWLDDADDRLFVFGGFQYDPVQYTPANDLWSFDLAKKEWSAQKQVGDAPLSPGGRVAHATAPNSLYFFGGVVKATSATPPVMKILDYSGESPSWSDAPFASTSPGSYTGSLVYDARRKRWLSVCGGSSNGFNCDVNAYSPTVGWGSLALAAGDQPKGRDGFHYAYDEETDRVFIYGGQVGAGNLAMIGDTWALELGETPAQWVKLVDESDMPGKRRNGAYALDPIGRRLLVWGGTPDGAHSVDGLQVLGLDRGRETWTSVSVPAEVPPRCSAMGAYDARRNQVFWGFGNNTTVYSDIWAMSL